MENVLQMERNSARKIAFRIVDEIEKKNEIEHNDYAVEQYAHLHNVNVSCLLTTANSVITWTNWTRNSGLTSAFQQQHKNNNKNPLDTILHYDYEYLHVRVFTCINFSSLRHCFVSAVARISADHQQMRTPDKQVIV